MEAAQSFRLVGETDVQEISCDHINGQHVIYLEDIELVFPGVKHVKNGNLPVKPLRDSDQNRLVPHRIKHYPGAVLDVVVSTSERNGPATESRGSYPTITSMENDVVDGLQVAHPVTDTSSSDSSRSALALHQESPFLDPKQGMDLQDKSVESVAEQRLVSSLPSDLQAKALGSSNTHHALVQAIKDGLVDRPNDQLDACFRQLKDEMIKNNELTSKNYELTSTVKDLVSTNNEMALENKELMARMLKMQEVLDAKQDEMKMLQTQALDRLVLLQNSVKALLTQTYELHEYPIPRLFIVLPEDSSSWNSLDMAANKFRLYFLCECGEHTKSVSSNMPHDIHLAKHEGYEIARFGEFFQQYGPYVLTLLRMLMFGISVAGVTVPHRSRLIRTYAMDQVADSLKKITDTLDLGMNQVIDCFERTTAGNGKVVGFAEQLRNNEALEGADLRQLESFLMNKDNNRVLGNLYRTVTADGHVKWVCIDHYRENYREDAAKTFRNSVKALHGSFEENIGRVEVTLTSRLQAEHFYVALEKARSVYELKVVLDWETTQRDFKALHDTLAITSVGVLELHLTQQDVPTWSILNRGQPYDPILDIMRHRAIRSFTIGGPCDFTKRSSLLSRNYDFPNLRHLEISLAQLRNDTAGVKRLIANSSNLSSLTLGSIDGNSRVSLGETASDLAYPASLQHLDLPLYLLKDDIPGFKRLTANTSNLSSLTLRTGALDHGNGYVVQAYNAIAKDRTYSVKFEDWNLCLPPLPPKESNRSMAAQQCMEDVLNLYCRTTSALDLNKNEQTLFWNTVESLRVLSKKDTDRVEVRLQSNAQAEYFYYVLEKARSVHELKVELAWPTTRGDLEQLRDALTIANVSVLELYLGQQDSISCILNRGQHYGPILDIMQNPSIESFTIRGLQDYSTRSSLLSRNHDFSNLRHLDIPLHQFKDDIPGFTYLITKAPHLSSLAVEIGKLKENIGHVLQACNAIAEHWTYPIHFKELALSIPPLPDRSTAAYHCMEHLLKPYYESTGQDLDDFFLDELTVDALAQATKDGSGFKTLVLTHNGQLSESFINNMCSIVARSELRHILIRTREDKGRVRVLELMQWKHLRELDIRLKPETFETKVMQALVDGVKKMEERIELDQFRFWTKADTPSILPQGDLLQTFVALVSIKNLSLEVAMTLEQMLSLFRAADFFRLEYLCLWAEGFDSVKVNAILDGLQPATHLKALKLCHINTTVKQRKRMRARGVNLFKWG